MLFFKENLLIDTKNFMEKLNNLKLQLYQEIHTIDAKILYKMIFNGDFSNILKFLNIFL